MSLDPGPILGSMIKEAIMKRIGDPYYGAGYSGGGVSGGRGRGRPRKGAGVSGGMKPKVGRPKGSGVSGGKRKVGRPKGSGMSGGRKRGGYIYGDMDGDGVNLPYMGKGNRTGASQDWEGAGYSGGAKGYCGTAPYMGPYGSNVGGRKRKDPAMKGGKKKKSNPWLRHLAAVRKQHPNWSVAEVSKAASKSYKR